MEELVKYMEPFYENPELLLTPGLAYTAVAGYYLSNAMARASNASDEDLGEIKSRLEERREELEEDVDRYGRQLTDMKEHLLHPRRQFKDIGYRTELARRGELEEAQQDPVRDDIFLEFFS